MVRPPPGVSSAVSVPSIASVSPRDERQAEPDAGGVVGVAEPLERHEHPVPVLLGDAGAAIDHAQLHPVAERGRRPAAAACPPGSSAARSPSG